MQFVKIWDLPTRLFHWGLVLAVTGAYVSEKLNAMDWHQYFGISIVGLLAFRLVWGVTGSTYSRFSAFTPSPKQIRNYLKGHWHGEGHNPLGALSVWAIILVLGTQAMTGLFSNDDSSFTGPLYDLISKSLSDNITGIHRQFEWITPGLAGLHVASILFYLFVKKNNLVAPMITGKKQTHLTESKAVIVKPASLFIAVIITGIALYLASGEWIAKNETPSTQEPTPDF